MKCPQCGKNSNVTISGKVYCTSCGAVIQDAPAAAATTPAAVKPAAPEPAASPAPAETPAAAPAPAAEAAPATPPPAAPKMMDIAAPGTPAPAAVQAPPTPADRPVVTPITTARTMQDVMRPAAAYHNPAPAPAAPAPAEPELKPITEHTTAPVPAAPTPNPAPQPTAAPASGRLATAQAVPKSDSIVKFHDPLPAGADPQPPTPQPVTVTPAPSPEPELPAAAPAAAVPAPPTVSAAPPAAPAPIVAAPAPAPEPTPAPAPVPELPPQAATQHEALSKLAEQPMTSKEEAFKLAMAAASASAAKPNPMAVGAAALAVVVMGGYIWLQNYPRMQLSAAAGRAGFTASLPGYVPSSYKLDRPAKATSGLVSLHYAAPGLPGITINQQVTSWDSSSLADNYVAGQDPSFSTVEGQGLTIYLYGSGKAAWVNHGIWYSITGATRLSRQELLKLAYSL